MLSLRLLKWAALGGAAYLLYQELKPGQPRARKPPLTEDEEVAYDLFTLEDELAIDIREANAAYDATDSGELYGMHVPRAQDNVLPDDDRAFADGQNWLEAMETNAAEGGPMPEAELNIIDDQDDASTAATLRNDRPIADFGSGGRRGL
jgi:hypothetical protein